MLVVVTPGTDTLLEKQEQERALYFSIGAEDVLRREGLISVVTLALDAMSSGPADPGYLFTRGLAPAPHQLNVVRSRPLAFEGPLSDTVLAWLGLAASSRSVEQLSVKDAGKGREWNVFRPSAVIGNPPKEATLPRIWNSRAIGIQLFDGIAPENILLFMTLPDGTTAPAIFLHNGIWISALPVFDLLSEHFTFPPLPARYVTRRRGLFDSLGVFVRDSLMSILADKAAMVTADRWPEGFRAAFSMRHDYDRALSDSEHDTLMALYRRTGVKCSMGYLGYLLPQRKIQDLAANGHEVQIHVFEHDSASLAAAVAHLAGIAGAAVVGATIHGGTSSLGFRGDVQLEWLERAGIRYTEIFSVGNYPAPIYRPDSLGIPRRSGMLTTPMHNSLDTSMKVGEHRLDAVRDAVTKILGKGHMAVAMNHPDLNRKELETLVAGLPRDGIWFATLAEICAWERCTKYEPTVSISGRKLSVVFRQEVPRDAMLKIQRPGVPTQQVIVPAGSRVLHLDAQGNAKFRAVARIQRPPLTARAQQALLRQGRLRKFLLAAREVYRRLRRFAGGKVQPVPPMDAILFSRVSTRTSLDATSGGVQPLSRIILQGADDAQGELDFVSLVAGEAAWPAGQTVIGQSVAQDLHPTVVGAMAYLIEKLAPEPERALQFTAGVRQSTGIADEAMIHLAGWIEAEAVGKRQLPRNELTYFLASTGLRARAMRNVLRASGPAKIGNLVDHGTGVGLMPWLLSREAGWVDRALLVEPGRKYHACLDELWDAPDRTPYDLFPATTEEFEYPDMVDVITFCHALYGVRPENRATLLNRAWNALRPGGCIVVNEVLTDETGDRNEKSYVNRAELVEILNWNQYPSLFRMERDWSVAEDPMTPPLATIGSTGFIVACKAKAGTPTQRPKQYCQGKDE